MDMHEVKGDKPYGISEPKAYKPTLRFNADDLPEIENWEVGEEYHLVIKATMKSFDKQSDESKEESHAVFEIDGVMPLEHSGEKEMEKMIAHAKTNSKGPKEEY